MTDNTLRPKDFESIGYLHLGSSDHSNKTVHHFSHPSDVTIDGLTKLHQVLKPLGYKPAGYLKDEGKAVWSKGQHHAVVSRRIQSRGLNEPPHKHVLTISEPHETVESTEIRRPLRWRDYR